VILFAITIMDKWLVEKMIDIMTLLLSANLLRLIDVHDLDI